jgi:saccharopine dehydrogenase-like NADP-dependent oxidoreductase
MVGSVIAADLASEGFEVAIADVNPASLRAAGKRAGPRAALVETDLSDPAALRSTIEPADIVIGALPGWLGYRALAQVVQAGRNCCDISFMPEDPLALDAAAKKSGATVVVDCGVAPGLSNMLAGVAAAELAPCRSIEIAVGGLPRTPRPPFNYKAAFSPADVIEEYTRPARLVEGGKVVVRPALSEVEPLDFAGVGTLEAFNTDGLRTLTRTLNVPTMKEKTIRYPGHAALMLAFREAGFFAEEKVAAGGLAVRPLDLSRALLTRAWTYAEGEEDLTVMRVVAEGTRRGAAARIAWEIEDHFDRATRTTSMSRVTAFPAALVARRLAAGTIRGPGVIPPEHLARTPGLVDEIVEELRARGVRIEREG